MQQDKKDDKKEGKEKIFYEVMDYAVNGELKDHVQGTSTRIPEKISAKIFLKIVLIVKYLHDNNITHCDIKPENVLLDKYFRPLLNDFGFSQIFEGNNGDFTLHKFAGSNIYCAPETRKAYTRGFDAIKNDIFSLGVLLFVITIGDFPFINTSFSDEKYKFIIKKNYERFWEFFNSIEISDEFKDLINNLIGLNPSQRFNIDQILEHPWIKKYNKEIKINDKNVYEIMDIDQDVINEFKSRKV
jgi:serine/threonine protein kinase